MTKIDQVNSNLSPSVQRELTKLKSATDEFEQILISMMLKEMHKNLGKTGFLDSGEYEKMFRDMLIDERAKEMSKGAGFGLSEKMYSQMKAHVLAQHKGAQDASGEKLPTPASEASLKALHHQNNIERIANDYRRTKGNQK